MCVRNQLKFSILKVIVKLKMVTTIKITCDGVFIQSNPFFTNAHMRRPPEGTSSSVGYDNGAPSESSLSSTTTSTSLSSVSDVTGELLVHHGSIGGGGDNAITVEGDVVAQSVQSMESGGNMTVVIRNNRRKIVGRFNGKEADPSGDGIWKEQQAARPSYHYMYLVRKVPANRALPSMKREAAAADDTVRRQSEAVDDCDNGVNVIDSGCGQQQKKLANCNDVDQRTRSVNRCSSSEEEEMMVAEQSRRAGGPLGGGGGLMEEEMQQQQQHRHQSPVVVDVGQ